jgi:hypothetical protein
MYESLFLFVTVYHTGIEQRELLCRCWEMGTFACKYCGTRCVFVQKLFCVRKVSLLLSPFSSPACVLLSMVLLLPDPVVFLRLGSFVECCGSDLSMRGLVF